MAERRPLVMIGGSLRELPDGDSIAMTRVWQSGMTVAQGERVISSLDWEEYRRIAATGGGATDPADDLTNYIALTYSRITSLGVSTSLTNSSSILQFSNGATKVVPPTIAAGVRTELLNATGRGALAFLAFKKGESGGGRFEVLVDGRSVFDASIQSSASDANILVGATSGIYSGGVAFPAYSAIPADFGLQFRRSAIVYYTPSGASTSVNTVLGYVLRALQ